ncbi:MAG TPA: alpha/beta hydrolase [Caulobacteraceae bacterium]|nr:alpha/beta hydrolase [Caulobacteraceae bacterium]
MAIMTRTSAASAPPSGNLYAVEGRRLALCRAGEGGPAVVFLPGAGLIGLDFLNVHQEIAGHTTSVLYDRGGTGWSDPVRLPRTATEVAQELRGLLEVADIPPPYVLVGHSLGGAYARRFAQLFAADIAGLVMLDPAHEGYAAIPGPNLAAQFRQALGLLPLLAGPARFYRSLFRRMFACWPEGLRETLVDYHLRAWSRSLQEAKTLQTEVFEELRAGGALPDVPMIVLAAMGIDPFMAPFASTASLMGLNARKHEIYAAFAASTPQGELRTLENAGHSTLHTDRPDAVIGAILDVAALTPPARSARRA